MGRAKKGRKGEGDGPSIDLLRELSSDISDMRMMSDIEEERFVPVFFSTAVNRCTGIGGWPLRRMAMVHGKESTGKSVFALGLAEAMRRHGHVPVIFDTEHSAESRWYNDLAFGEGTLFKMPSNMDDVINDVQAMLNQLAKIKKGTSKKAKALRGTGYCFVIDTLTKLIPKDELEQMMKEGIGRGYPIAALFISRWMKSLIPQIYRSNSSMIMVVQDRENLDPNSRKKTKTTCGTAIRFDSSMRVEMKYMKKLKKGDVVIGGHHHFGIEKNKVDGQLVQGAFFTSNGRGDVPAGFDYLSDAIEEGKERGMVKKRKGLITVKVDLRGSGETLFAGGVEGDWRDLRAAFTEGTLDLKKFVDALNEEARVESNAGRQ
jgi:RecA/RadA recombinase